MVEKNVWSLEAYAFHNEQLRALEEKRNDERFKHLTEVTQLNDRRYGEVNVEKEKALKIKETADLTALELARESQVYKDERNDAMREQSLKDNGIYATRDDLADVVTRFDKTIKPVLDYVSSQQGVTQGSSITVGRVFAIIAAVGTIIGIIVVVANAFMK